MKQIIIRILKVLLDYLHPPLISECGKCGKEIKIRDDDYFYGCIQIIPIELWKTKYGTEYFYDPLCAKCTNEINTTIALER